MTDRKKVGVRVESRFHEIEPDASEAFCYFAEMIGEAGEIGDMIGGGDDNFTSKDADALTNFMREIFESDDDATEVYTEGELFINDNMLEVRYREPKEVTGMGPAVTSLSFDMDSPGIVTITRRGYVYSTLVIERGVRHTCAYNASGTAPFLIYTMAKRVDNKLTADGGELNMTYMVETQAGPVQFNRVAVKVTIIDDVESEVKNVFTYRGRI